MKVCMIVRLLYLTASHSNIAYTISDCAHYQSTPRVSLLHSLMRIPLIHLNMVFDIRLIPTLHLWDTMMLIEQNVQKIITARLEAVSS